MSRRQIFATVYWISSNLKSVNDLLISPSTFSDEKFLNIASFPKCSLILGSLNNISCYGEILSFFLNVSTFSGGNLINSK